MAKQTGIGMNLYVDEYNLSGDVGAVDTISTSRTLLNVTGIDKDAMERLPGIGDHEIAFTSFYNPSNAHAALSPMGTAVQYVTVTLGTAIGQAAASMADAQANYNQTRGQDGSLVFNSTFQQAGGTAAIWGHLVTNGAETIASAGTATDDCDSGVTSTNGATAYLHAISIASGTCTIVLQHSTDDSTYAALGTFTAFAAATSQQLALSGTVNRYVRRVATGTFSNAVAAVTVVRNL